MRDVGSGSHKLCAWGGIGSPPRGGELVPWLLGRSGETCDGRDEYPSVYRPFGLPDIVLAKHALGRRVVVDGDEHVPTKT